MLTFHITKGDIMNIGFSVMFIVQDERVNGKTASYLSLGSLTCLLSHQHCSAEAPRSITQQTVKSRNIFHSPQTGTRCASVGGLSDPSDVPHFLQ